MTPQIQRGHIQPVADIRHPHSTEWEGAASGAWSRLPSFPRPRAERRPSRPAAS